MNEIQNNREFWEKVFSARLVIPILLIVIGISLMYWDYTESNREYLNETISICDKSIFEDIERGKLLGGDPRYYVKTDRGTMSTSFEIFSMLIEGRTYNVRTYDNHIYVVYGSKP